MNLCLFKLVNIIIQLKELMHSYIHSGTSILLHACYRRSYHVNNIHCLQVHKNEIHEQLGNVREWEHKL